MRDEGSDRDDTCYLPSCGRPARYTVNVGDEAGVALRRVCDEHYAPES